MPGLSGWLLCSDFDPLDCEFEEQFKQYDELMNASSADEGEVLSAVYFGKSLQEVSKNYRAWKKCKLIFGNPPMQISDAWTTY